MNLEQRVRNTIEALQMDRKRRQSEGFDAAHPLEAAAAALRSDTPWQSGDIWSVRGASDLEMPCLIVVTRASKKGLEGYLVSDRTWMASHEDFHIPQSKSPSGEALLVCTWRPISIEPARLRGYVGAIESGLLEALELWEERKARGQIRLRAQLSTPQQDGSTLVKWTLSRRSTPEDLRHIQTGPRILDDQDPRLELRACLTEWTAYLAPIPAASPSEAPQTSPWWGRLVAWWESVLESIGPRQGFALAAVVLALIAALVWTQSTPVDPDISGPYMPPHNDLLKGAGDAQITLGVFEWQDGRATSIPPSSRPTAPVTLLFDVEINQPGHLSLWRLSPMGDLEVMASGTVPTPGRFTLSPEPSSTSWSRRGQAQDSGTWVFSTPGAHRLIVAFNPAPAKTAPEKSWLRSHLPSDITKKLIVKEEGVPPTVLLVDQLLLGGQ